jgi:YidC/Oxa1 family membrane protein insertase
MQNRNLLFMIVVTLLMFVGWQQFVLWMWPPRPKKPHPPEPALVQLPMPQLWAGLPAALEAVNAQACGGGLGNAWALASSIALAEYSSGERQAAVQKPAEPVKQPQQAKIEALPPEPHREVVLGDNAKDSSFNFKVVLTSRGAGVQELILNKFLQANRLGLPEGEFPPLHPANPAQAALRGQALHLIPDNPKEPSNLLYHYASSDDSHPEHPLDLLGKVDWAVQSIKNGPNDKVHEAVFSTKVPKLDVLVTKTFSLEPGTYHLGLTLRFERLKSSNTPLSFRYQLTGGHGLPIEGDWYTTIFRNAMIGLVDSHHQVWRDLQMGQNIGVQEGGREVMQTDEKFIRYAGIATQYFASVVVVDNNQDKGIAQNFVAWARPTVEGPLNKEKPFLNDMNVRLVSEPIDLQPGVPVVHKYLLYNGPVKVRLLGYLDGGKAVNEDLVLRYESESQLGLYSLTDVGNFSFWSTLLIKCTNIMHSLMWVLHTYVMPWSLGLCIILLTLLVRGAMFPFSRRQALASARMQEKMAELQPEIKKLEEKYKNDRMELQRAKQELMFKRGINPLAMMGSCWMVFAQMPIFLGLYYSLQESINFRLAPFLWIKNLAAPDMLVWWTEKIPAISTPETQGTMPWGILYLGPCFNLLPIIAVTFMIIQQKLLTPPPTDEQQEMQQKMMKYMMIFFGVMFYRVAAGLCLYFIVSSGWGLAERKLFLPKKTPGTRTSGGDSLSRPAKLKPKGPKSNGNGTFQKVKEMWEEVLKEARKK